MRWLMILLVGMLQLSCTIPSANLGNRYQYSYSLVKPDTTGMSWQDDLVRTEFVITDKEIGFKLWNKTDEPLKVIWDDASIVQFDKAHKIMHAGVKYVDRSQSQPPTSVPPGAMIEDVALPADKIHYREGHYSTYYSQPGGWESYDLFPTYDLGKPDTAEFIVGLKGSTLGLYLPIQQGEAVHTYNFVFQIVDVRQVSTQK